jgi:hypothetical protein
MYESTPYAFINCSIRFLPKDTPLSAFQKSLYQNVCYYSRSLHVESLHHNTAKTAARCLIGACLTRFYLELTFMLILKKYNAPKQIDFVAKKQKKLSQLLLSVN